MQSNDCREIKWKLQIIKFRSHPSIAVWLFCIILQRIDLCCALVFFMASEQPQKLIKFTVNYDWLSLFIFVINFYGNWKKKFAIENGAVCFGNRSIYQTLIKGLEKHWNFTRSLRFVEKTCRQNISCAEFYCLHFVLNGVNFWGCPHFIGLRLKRKCIICLQFKHISQAYEVLADPKKREMYDQGGEEAIKGGGSGSGFDFHSPMDIFDMFFGGGGRRHRGPQKGKDVIHPLRVSLEDLYNGATRKLSLKKKVICSKCEGKLNVNYSHIYYKYFKVQNELSVQEELPWYHMHIFGPMWCKLLTFLFNNIRLWKSAISLKILMF